MAIGTTSGSKKGGVRLIHRGGRPRIGCSPPFTQPMRAWNELHWKNPRFNELLLAARSESDETKRAAMYAEMQQLVHDD